MNKLKTIYCLKVCRYFLCVLFVVFITCGTLSNTVAKENNVSVVEIGFLKQLREKLPKLSNLELPPDDDGVLGGEQGVIDNNGTGQFLNQKFTFTSKILDVDDDPETAFKELYEKGIRHFITDLSLHALLKLSDSTVGKQAWFYNIGASEDLLRTQECRANILHFVPSYAMKADALAQYLIAKRWKEWFLVIGRREADREFASAVRRAAKKFGGKIIVEKVWEYGPDARRTAQADVPVFTQKIDYDVLIVADVVGEFGEYLMYRTWEPKIVAGTQGLIPVTWHRTHEIWGAAQMQSRFLKNYNRRMSEQEYNVWSAIRAIGEAATRTQSVDASAMATYLRSENFELAGYKGQKMTFRTWNGQLRQPILLVWAKSLVSVSPQPQFLHQHSQLDSLGYDEPESKCRLQH